MDVAPAIAHHAGLDSEEVWNARVDLAACFRAAARLGMNEGVCNHLSAMVPGHDDLFLVNPDGWGFGEITASRLLICDFHRNVVAGTGEPEDSAFFIHARVHARVPRARAAFHTHMPYSTALAMVEGEPFSWALQTSLRFHGRLAIDDNYNGVALDESEGERIAGSIGDADIVFMKNHGVMVLAGSIQKAWDDLFYLERAAEAEVLALSTGRKLQPVSPEIIARTNAQIRGNSGNRHSARMHLDSVKRLLDHEQPEYKC
jgi:ribulose-5-phosphate 4-epimerase/fuculose-1-phosphate aldolase